MSPRHPVYAARIAELLREFKLTAAADELVLRLVSAGQDDTLAIIAEVLVIGDI